MMMIMMMVVKMTDVGVMTVRVVMCFLENLTSIYGPGPYAPGQYIIWSSKSNMV